MKTTAFSVGAPAIAKALALAITLTALVGCGQKGPLTLPAATGAASAPASAPAR